MVPASSACRSGNIPTASARAAGQQGRAGLLSGQATALENFSHRNNVISSLEFYRCQILPFLVFLAVGHVLTPHSWYHMKKWVWGVHLSQPGTIQRFGPERLHTLRWFPVLLVSDLISHCQSHLCPTYLMFSIASPAKTICYFITV